MIVVLFLCCSARKTTRKQPGFEDSILRLEAAVDISGGELQEVKVYRSNGLRAQVHHSGKNAFAVVRRPLVQPNAYSVPGSRQHVDRRGYSVVGCWVSRLRVVSWVHDAASAVVGTPGALALLVHLLMPGLRRSVEPGTPAGGESCILPHR